MRREPDGATVVVHDAVRKSLEAELPAGSPIAVALSGGRDSVVLLDALATVAPTRRHAVTAIHVHHGLSANADRWAQDCVERCGALRGYVQRAPAFPSARIIAESLPVR